jgi:hypothetical protein
MDKSKKKAKLLLNRETVRSLKDDSLEKAGGAGYLVGATVLRCPWGKTCSCSLDTAIGCNFYP